MSVFHALCQACGLSLREASEFHGVRIDTVKSWSSGRNQAPAGVLVELSALALKIIQVATESYQIIERQGGKQKGPGEIELGLSSDDHEAQWLGWPCVGAHRACLGLVAAMSIQAGHTVKIVPRGSTPGTAAAADAHGV